jgi:hypothetical protein
MQTTIGIMWARSGTWGRLLLCTLAAIAVLSGGGECAAATTSSEPGRRVIQLSDDSSASLAAPGLPGGYR